MNLYKFSCRSNLHLPKLDSTDLSHLTSGILLYEMLYGYTPFRGKTRQRTFANILHKDLKFPGSKAVSFGYIN